MSVETLDSIKKQVDVLSFEEKTDLANYLLRQTEKISTKIRQTDEEIRRKRMAWLKANREKYGGQFVVLDGDRLLGTAKTFIEGKKIAADAGVPEAFVNYLSKTDEEGYLAGW